MEQFTKLTAKLSELFELEKADLDFGIHRIIKARQKKIQTFLSDDIATDQPTLKKIVLREMGEANSAELQASLDQATDKLKDEFGKRAFEGDQLTDLEALGSPEGKLWKELTEKLTAGTTDANAQLEAEIYSHLTTFFSRYYSDADFISQRRIKAGDTPYAVPYSGEEVMLHWANKDQYYIKSSKDLKDYTFTLADTSGKKKRVQFKCHKQDPVLNNNNAKREFHLADPKDAPIKVINDALLIPFHYKIVEKTRTAEEKKSFNLEILDQLPGEWQNLLLTVPDGAKNDLLTRHLTNYTKKNESDFFIHKHLSKFFNRELDFYIKNEVMHLDDIDEKSADYLTAQIRKIKAIRTIAKHIITFLAQLENFQKKIWLKKKYITETNYCITLDQILATDEADDLLATVLEQIETPIRRYDGIKRTQHDEWIKLYAIDELEDYPANKKLTAAFLKAHDKLMLNTVFYPPNFKWQLLGAMDNLEEQFNGLLIHSDNFQALRLLQNRYRKEVKCIYIDPPYNTATSAIPYKNNYKHSSFATLMRDRLVEAAPILADDGAIFVSIDKTERTLLEHTLDEAFGSMNHIEELIWTQATANSQLPNYSTNHEYVEVYAKNRAAVEGDVEMFREPKPGYSEVMDLVAELSGSYPAVSEIEDALKTLYENHREEYRQSVEDSGQEWDADAKRQDPWRGIYPYLRAEYRNSEDKLVVEDQAKKSKAMIRVWSEIPTGAPASKQSITTKDPKHHNYRFYKPIHPETKKECPHPQSGWKFPAFPDEGKPNRRSFQSLQKDDRIAWGQDENKVPRTKGFLHEVETNIGTSVFYEYNDGEAELARMFGESGMFLSPKSSKFVKKFILQTMKLDSYFVDFFGGSGSSAHGLIQANREDGGSRRFVTVEMEEYFDSITMPRIIKSFYASDWRNGRATGQSGMSGAFKYLRLESYEDALNNLQLEDKEADLLGLDDSVKEDYLLSYMLDVETDGHLMNLERFQDPWGCQLKIHDPHTGEAKATTIDLIETFNYLMGFTLKELKVKDGFLTLEAENPQGESVLIIWRKLAGGEETSDWKTTTNADLSKFIESRRINLADTEYAALYINGDHTLHDPHSKIGLIEDLFYDRMFANTGNPDD